MSVVAGELMTSALGFIENGPITGHARPGAGEVGGRNCVAPRLISLKPAGQPADIGEEPGYPSTFSRPR